jgi:hypothetical protein
MIYIICFLITSNNLRENKNRHLLPDYKLNLSLCAPGQWEGPIGMERAVVTG